ncbi:hypothetical protein ACJX0J_024990 [Zea mays]
MNNTRHLGYIKILPDDMFLMKKLGYFGKNDDEMMSDWRVGQAYEHGVAVISLLKFDEEAGVQAMSIRVPSMIREEEEEGNGKQHITGSLVQQEKEDRKNELINNDLEKKLSKELDQVK